MFTITQKDIDHAIETTLISQNPLQIKLFPAKEKRKYILLCMMCHLFEKDRTYTEKQVNEILKNVYVDYVTLRRYLIIYDFLARTPDGHSYWLIANPEEFTAYIQKKKS